jgi:ubiquinone/menaquinone biosynthesis C-methylase UbiE
MTCLFVLRDLLIPRMQVLKEVGIREGDHVLDYGCGPGGYIVPLAKLVGRTGKIYALDMHPLAMDMVRRRVATNHLENVETIHSECDTGLPDKSLDVVLLYDIFHFFDDPDRILKEIHRILKPEGVLSFSDHHMKEPAIVSGVTEKGFFTLLHRNKKTYSFAKRITP